MSTKNNINAEVKTACDSAKEVGCQVRKIIDKTSTEAKAAAHEVEGQIRRSPVTATLMAAGVGFILGAIFNSRKS